MNISKSMLNMACLISKPIGKDRDRNIIYSEPITLENIYLSFAIGQAEGSNGKEKQDNCILFYDCFASLPCEFNFSTGMKITFNNRDFYVAKIKPCFGLNGLEHYEIEAQ